MTAKPALWITRKLSAATEARATRDYDVRLNPQDRVFSRDEIVAMSEEVDAILPCHSEIFSSDVAARLSDRVKIIANHSVGVDHCDLEALKVRGIVVTNTPDVLSKATAETALLLMLGAARRGGGDGVAAQRVWTVSGGGGRFFVGLAGVTLVVTYLIWTGVSETMVYYLTPTELIERVEADPTFRELGVKVSGRLIIDSEVGRGSTFTVTLPIEPRG